MQIGTFLNLQKRNTIRTLISKNQFCGNVTGNLDPKYYTAWVIDSGASDHISSFSHYWHQINTLP
jgi:hypothetical protein